MLYQIIKTDDELADYCYQIKNVQYFALDTEFVRTKTFYPHLGLLQIFDGKNTILVDPLSINNWNPLISVLHDIKSEKYFHACGEDIEVFLHHFNCLPLPILDSQIFASFLDNPLSSGYAALVKKYLNIELDKSETRTDWLQRPLSAKQCQYAAYDVYYLLPLVEKLKDLLIEKGWLNAAYEECNNSIKRKTTPFCVDNAYLNIKHAWQLTGESLGYLKKLAAWRFNYAQNHDIALNFVVHNDVLLKLARYCPTSLAELSALGVRGKEIRLFGEILLDLLSETPENIPPIKQISHYPDYKKWTMLIKESSAKIALETGLSVELLASKRQIEQYIRWHHCDSIIKPELLSGWRAELFRPYLNLYSC